MPVARCLLVLAATILSPFSVVDAQDQDDAAKDGGKQEGDQELRERDAGDRPERERGPRDGDRTERDRGPRDGDRPPMRDGEHRGGDRPPRPTSPMGPILDLLDRNHNGVLESEEIDQAIVVLRRMDRNGDGRLTGEEFGPRRDGDRPPMREGDRSPEGPRPLEAGREGQRPTVAQMKERFLEADKDGDKKLSKDEAPGRLKKGFDRVDSDGSGFLEMAELEAMIRRPEQGQGRGPQEGDRGADRERGDGDRQRERGKERPAAE